MVEIKRIYTQSFDGRNRRIRDDLTDDEQLWDELLEFTNKNGVMTRPIWELMNRLPMFADCQTDGLENSIWFADRVVNIPSSAIIPGYRK